VDFAAYRVLPELQGHKLVGVDVFQKPMALVVHVLLMSGYPEIGVDGHFTEKILFKT
jgi:hypothetical protein